MTLSFLGVQRFSAEAFLRVLFAALEDQRGVFFSAHELDCYAAHGQQSNVVRQFQPFAAAMRVNTVQQGF